MNRTAKEIKEDSPCIGVCTLNEENICIGCDRHIDEIIDMGSDADNLPQIDP
jgi:predicted Fe-S protein YdhL (DUF1289 family)